MSSRSSAAEPNVAMNVVAVVEQFWHALPGGTATASGNVLQALWSSDQVGISAIAARHRRAPKAAPPFLSEVALKHIDLPRPLLYELWLRLGLPSVDDYCPSGAVLWAPSMIVPPCSVPVVTTVHDLDFLKYPEYLTKRGRRFFPLAWRVAQQRTQLFVCPSQVVADDLNKVGIDSERIRVVPWGVHPPLCLPAEVDLVLANLGLPERFVLWVGPIEPRKNPGAAVAAMSAVDCDLVAVGKSVGHSTAERELALLGERLHRLESVDALTLSALYQRAEALLYPSLAEGFGLPVLEAMSHGTPVVTSSTTATAEVAAEAALLVDPQDHKVLAEALVALLSEQALRVRLSESGKVRAGQLSWTAAAKQYLDAFKSVQS